MKIAVGLTFPGALKDESVICYLAKNYNITLNIIEASFSMSSGWAILEFDGEEEEIKRAFVYLGEKDIKIQKIKQES
ncbi:MAG: NIL domain-containing protein [Candidatus Omnitrophica bacterium]|nr:NIL domain-containing protein [Candidatus Omnitrophota bacterium]MDD5653383.1 NIL domain-containing protein [Candidatus Omnitrophota bacterium]